MIPLVEERIADIGRLCREHRVARLELIGSAAAGRYEPGVSDLDFLVTFRPDAPPGGFGGPVTGLSVALSDLLGTRVDLIEEPRIRDPYLLQGIDASPKAPLYLCADAPPPPRGPVAHIMPGSSILELRTVRYLKDMHDAAEAVLAKLEGMTLADYMADAWLRLGVERSFEMIGEAANRLALHNPEAAARITDIGKAIGLRNIIAHEYYQIDAGKIWQAVEDLPQLIRDTEALLGEE